MSNKIKRAGVTGLSWNIELVTSDHYTGKIIEKTKVHNTIVDTGLERTAKLLGGISTTPFIAIAIGTGDTAVTTSDTALETEVARAEASTATYEASFKMKWSHKFTFGSGESFTITEVGVFDNATSGGAMLNRALDAGKVVDADTDLTVNVTVTVGRAS